MCMFQYILSRQPKKSQMSGTVSATVFPVGSLAAFRGRSVQFSSVAQSCPTLCDPMNRSTPGLPVHHQLPEFTQTHVPRVVMPSSHLILCHPLLLLPPIPPSIRVFSNETTLHMRWPKYCSFSFGISPSNEHPGLISFRMDWLHLLAVQGTLKSLLQHHSSKASIVWRSAFFRRRQWHPTPVLLPGKSHGWRSLVGCSPQGSHGVARTQTRLSNFTFTFHFHALEKEMATHSSVLALRIPGTGEPGGLPSMGLHRVRHN